MIRIELRGISSGMDGVGNLPDGRVAFVRGALPGEIATIEITRERANCAWARAVGIERPSPDRVAPRCPHYGACGGCDLQHAGYEAGLRFKRTVASDALRRIGGFGEGLASPVIGADEPWRSRSKAEYRLERYGGAYRFGMTGVDGRSFVPVDDCLLQRPSSVAAARAAAEWLSLAKPAPLPVRFVTRVDAGGAVMAILSGRGTDSRSLRPLADYLAARVPELHSLYRCELRARPAHATDGIVERVAGREGFTETLCGLRFELSPDSFFQVHRAQAETLVERALTAVRKGGFAVDAYCGVGSITLPAAKIAGRVVGIESNPAAVRDARRNVAQNGLDGRVDIVEGDAGERLAEISRGGAAPDAVLLDPPRKGADGRMIAALIAARPHRIAYVSCDPATLARDAAKLAVDGRYRLKSVDLIDMFCYTRHIEAVAIFEAGA